MVVKIQALNTRKPATIYTNFWAAHNHEMIHRRKGKLGLHSTHMSETSLRLTLFRRSALRERRWA